MIKAIGFDLFNTLLVAHPETLEVATKRLLDALCSNGLTLDPMRFLELHKAKAVYYIKESQLTGRETHNSLWISAAFKELGYQLEPNSPLIESAVEAYFSAFYDLVKVIPGTHAFLEELKSSFKLALVSNFTHHPACQRLLEILNLLPYFDFCLISGKFGFRKPHPSVFQAMCEALEVEPGQTAFVGDDLESDIHGALNAGLKAVWTSYVMDHNLPFAPGYVQTQVRPEDVPAPRISTWHELRGLIKEWA